MASIYLLFYACLEFHFLMWRLTRDPGILLLVSAEYSPVMREAFPEP